MTYSAILFDLDGTLLNTLDDLCQSMNRVLEAHGFASHEANAYRYFVGNGEEKLVQRALPENARDEQTFRACLADFQKDYAAHYTDHAALYPGIASMLDHLTQCGLRLAVLSNKPQDLTRMCVSEYMPQWTFDIVAGAQQDVPIKPDPKGALLVAEAMGLPPAAFLYLGDSSMDMQTATSAGMVPVGVAWGFRPEAELKEYGAQTVLKTPMDITALLS